MSCCLALFSVFLFCCSTDAQVGAQAVASASGSAISSSSVSVLAAASAAVSVSSSASSTSSTSRHLPVENSFQFPKDQDILFPSQSVDSDNENVPSLYKISDFSFNTQDNLPDPRITEENYIPPPRPGHFYPPAPKGYRQRRRKNGRRRLCERKYSEYIERIFPNDTAIKEDAHDEDFDGRVLARPGQYPHMAALGFRMSNNETDYKCGGSLISENIVLTAAHCTEVEGIEPTTVRIGGLNLMVDEQTVKPQNFAIKSIMRHPDYNIDSYYNDIAVVRLERNINLTEFVRPIRLWINPDLPTSIAFAMGYGSTSFGRSSTHRLTHLNLTIVGNDECNSDLPAFEDAANGIIESQICAQDFLLNRDTCQGDSGGPLQLNLQGRRRRNRFHYHLIGITSYGVFCRSNYPSVYTRVVSYLDWIEQLTWNTPES